MIYIRHLQELAAANLPRSEIAIVHSAWLSAMDIRQNGDLDLLISSKLRNAMFSNCDPYKTVGLPGPLERRIRFQPMDSSYGAYYGAKGVDDVIVNRTVDFAGFRFIEPKFYFMFKKERLERLVSNEVMLPRWKKMFPKLFNDTRVLRKKILRDRRDLAAIEAFLDNGKHLAGIFSDYSPDMWDSDSRAWRP